jgi:hypothetical protein
MNDQIARGRDAADVAISTAFGPAQLACFKVITDHLKEVDQDSALKEAGLREAPAASRDCRPHPADAE